MPVVTLAGLGHHRAPGLDVERIGGVRRPDLAVLIGGLVRTPRARILIPLGQRIALVVGHQAHVELLPVPPRLVERGVDDVPAVLAAFGLQLRPEPANVRHRGLRKIHLARRIFDLGGRTHLRPLQPRIDRLPVVALKRLDAHSGVHQNVVDHLGTDHRALRRGGTEDQEKQRKSSHRDSFAQPIVAQRASGRRRPVDTKSDLIV